MSNNVDHPGHYNRPDSMECIDEMVLVFGVEALKQFCLCNVWKYRYRASDKNGQEDLKKSDWYMNKYNELVNKNTLNLSPIHRIIVGLDKQDLLDGSRWADVYGMFLDFWDGDNAPDVKTVMQYITDNFNYELDEYRTLYKLV